MELFIEDPVEAQEPINNYVEIDYNPSHILLLADPPTHQTYILQTTPITLQTVPIALVPTEAPEPTKAPPKKKRRQLELNPIFSCKTCTYTTHDELELNKHQETHWVVKKNVQQTVTSEISGQAEEEYKCPNCNYFTPNIRSLRIHMHIHAHKKSFKCLDCNFNGNNLQELISHHKRSRMIKCKYCTFSSHNKELFRAHREKNHQAKWYGCTKCKFAAADMSYLKKHMMDHHSNALRFDPVIFETEEQAKE